jgi:hypothetical protein
VAAETARSERGDAAVLDAQPGVVQATAVSRRSMNITLVGDFFSAETMREKFIPAIESAYRDGFGSVNLVQDHNCI